MSYSRDCVSVCPCQCVPLCALCCVRVPLLLCESRSSSTSCITASWLPCVFPPLPQTKHETPKYGLIYHASLVGQSAPKNKGKISRVLAAKCALAIRVDALGETSDTTVGNEGRDKVEARLRQLEGLARVDATGGAK